jgi:hypothetical protein
MKTKLFTLLLLYTGSLYANDSIYRFELEGSMSVSTFNKSAYVLIVEKAGANINSLLNLNLFGEQQYRNNSFTNNFFAGCELRLNAHHFQIPVGAFAGFKDIHIGSYHKATPIGGINSGLNFPVTTRVQLRLSYRGKLYRDEILIWGNDITAGFCVLFLRN